MRYRTLGRTGLQVSEIGFGAWAIGQGSGKGIAYGLVDDAASVAAIQRALDLGITFFDTADVYGHGHSEDLIGRTLGAARKNAVLATKVGCNFYGSSITWDYSPDHIRRACEESLKRLRTDAIDLYQLHNPQVRDLDALETLQDLKRLGKVRFIGVSVAGPEEARAAIERGADAVQLIYSYLETEHKAATFPHGGGAGIIAREPLCRGLLSGKYGANSTFPENDVRSKYPPDVFRAMLANVEEFRGLKKPDLTMVQAALKFVLAEPPVSVVIPGIKTAKQAEENASASDGRYELSGDVFHDEDVEAGFGGDA